MSFSKSAIIFQVPANTRLVLRNVWGSALNEDGPPETRFKGYAELGEGWNLNIPIVWREIIGLVSLNPRVEDPAPTEINIKGTDFLVEIDWSYESKVCSAPWNVENYKPIGDTEKYEAHLIEGIRGAAILYAVKIGTNIERRLHFEQTHIIEAIQAVTSGMEMEQINEKRPELQYKATKRANQLLCPYGLQVVVRIQNAKMPKIDRDAAERETAAERDARALNTWMNAAMSHGIDPDVAAALRSSSESGVIAPIAVLGGILRKVLGGGGQKSHPTTPETTQENEQD